MLSIRDRFYDINKTDGRQIDKRSSSGGSDVLSETNSSFKLWFVVSSK